MAPPDPAAAKLIEPNKPVSAVTASPIPEVVASAPATDEEADEAISQKVAIQRTEFGVDLGTANSVGGLRALWRGLLKSKSNAPLTALRPIIVIKERSNGLGMQLRLVAGPLNDAGAAAKICAVLTENKRSCETTIFDGQRLMMKSEDRSRRPPGRRTAPARYRRARGRRGAAEEARNIGGIHASRRCSAARRDNKYLAASVTADFSPRFDPTQASFGLSCQRSRAYSAK